jgi:hypothetical protein
MYNEGAIGEYRGLIKFAKKGSSDSSSIDSNKTSFIFTMVRDKEVDLLLD